MKSLQKKMLKVFSDSEKCLTTFRSYFTNSINDVKPPYFHYEWSQHLLHGNCNMAIEAFRESAKSTIVARDFPLHLLSFPNVNRRFVLFVMANETLSGQKLKEVWTRYINDAVLSLNLVKSLENSTKCIHAIVTNGDGEEVEVRMEAYGKGGSIRGRVWNDLRPQIVICDDLQDLDDSRSPTTLERDWSWFKSDLFFLGENGRIFMIGNNLGEACLIERVIRNKAQLGFTTYKIPITSDNFATSNWEEKFPIDKVIAERDAFAEMDSLGDWYLNKMCECIVAENQLFKPEYFKSFNLEDLNEDSYFYTVIDLAVSEEATACYTAIVTIAIPPIKKIKRSWLNGSDLNRWFVVSVKYGRWDINQQIHNLFEEVKRWQPRRVGFEAVAYQAVFKKLLEGEMSLRGEFFNVVELDYCKKKELRVEGLAPRYKQGLIWHCEQDKPGMMELERELLVFPHGEFIDAGDALAYFPQFATAPPFEEALEEGFADVGF